MPEATQITQNIGTLNAQRFAVAPMMDWTDKNCRYFHRIISNHAYLYSEMVTTGAILYGDKQRHLQFNDLEHPIALQLGGSDPKQLAQAAKIGADFGYDAINLNVGCPSDRVQNGRFGACLMAEPQLVAECIAAMGLGLNIPVTVKCRIGIDDQDSYAELVQFISTVADAGCSTFIIHARKAWLSGLSPKENREIPPLRYDVVQQIKQDFPHLTIIINGGITSISDALMHLHYVDGVMLGREVYHNPYLLAEVDALIFNQAKNLSTRQEIVLACLPYIETLLKQGFSLNAFTRHMLGLFHGQPGARAWRRYLSENATKSGADQTVLLRALEFTNL